MSGKLNSTVFAASVLVLSACAVDGSGEARVYTPLRQDIFPTEACRDDTDKHLADVDWSKAEAVDLRLRYGEFDRMLVTLTQDKPYILRIANGDDGSNVFQAKDFFFNAAIGEVSIAGELQSENCLVGLSIPGGQTAEVRLVPLRDGEYPYDDYILNTPYLSSLGLDGMITVETP